MTPVMSERIARFLAEQTPETPCLVVDLDVIVAAYEALRRYLPLARIYYAVKANPAAEIVAMLEPQGRQFRRREPRRNRALPRQRRSPPTGCRSATR